MPTEADLERAFYGANCGFSEAQIAGKSLNELRTAFLALSLTKTPNPKATISTTTSASSTGVITPANAAYTQADQTALANAVIDAVAKVNALSTQFNALRTALINANLIQ